jgi:hypothetical protein
LCSDNCRATRNKTARLRRTSERKRFNEPQHEPSIHNALEAELEAFPPIAQQTRETPDGLSNLKHSKYRGSPERDLRCKFH